MKFNYKNIPDETLIFRYSWPPAARCYGPFSMVFIGKVCNARGNWLPLLQFRVILIHFIN